MWRLAFYLFFTIEIKLQSGHISKYNNLNFLPVTARVGRHLLIPNYVIKRSNQPLQWHLPYSQYCMHLRQTLDVTLQQVNVVFFGKKILKYRTLNFSLETFLKALLIY